MRFRILVPAILTIALSTVVAPAHAATPVRTVSDAMALAASPAGLYNLTLEVTDSGVRGSLVVAGQSIAISGTRER